jgi:hypothetical protein
VECASGERIATLTADHGACSDFAFTPDEEYLLFHAEGPQKSVFSMWSTKTRQIARTFPDIPVTLQLAPDGNTLLANLDASGVDLLDLRTGQKRRLAGKLLGENNFIFTPDQLKLVRHTAGQLEVWDLPSATRRCTIALGERAGLWPELFISADSRVLCAVLEDPKEFAAWSLESGARLWPPEPPAPPPQPPPVNGMVEVEEIVGGGLVPMDAFYPRFTPDHRFLIDRTHERIDVLDPATGQPRVRMRVGRSARPWLKGFTPDGRFMLTHWRYEDERKPWFGEEWLDSWWPKSTGCLVVAEVATGKVQFHAEDYGNGFSRVILSEDGGTLLTSFTDGDVEVISCRDVPGRPSLLLVVGIPLALGVVGALIWWWLRRKSAARQPVPRVL